MGGKKVSEKAKVISIDFQTSGTYTKEGFLMRRTVLIGLFVVVLLAAGKSLQAGDSFSDKFRNELLSGGNTLPVDSSMNYNYQASGRSNIGTVEPRMPSYGVDTSRINPAELNQHAIGEMGNLIAGQVRDFALDTLTGSPVASTLVGPGLTIYNFTTSLRQAQQEGPSALRGTIPHAVMAWESMRGPENFPTVITSRIGSSSHDDGSLRIHNQTNQTIRQDFNTTAPGALGRWGFDPSTDSISRHTTTHTTHNEAFDGSRFNNSFRDNSFNSFSSFNHRVDHGFTNHDFGNHGFTGNNYSTNNFNTGFNAPSVPVFTPPPINNLR